MKAIPAATVSISNWGDWIVTPAVIDSNVCSSVPAYRDTSVLVPPISKPITGFLR